MAASNRRNFAMFISLLVTAVALTGGQSQPVTLARKFKQGEKLAYEVNSKMTIEERQDGVETFIPSDLELNYGFTTEVVQLKADGIAVLQYKRPTMTVITGETFDSGPKKSIEKQNMNMRLTVSPVNEILEMKDTPGAKWNLPAFLRRQDSDPIVGFLQDIQRLSMFTGSFDNALDFTPKLPLTPVSVGEKWSRTVSYQPQKLKGTSKTVMQRLDYHYTYAGLVTVNGKQYQRVEATMDLNTDLAALANQYVPEEELEAGEGLAKLPIQLSAKIQFDLDPQTGHTVRARAQSEGGYNVSTTAEPGKLLFEQKFRGETTMKLKPAAPAVPAKTPAKPKPVKKP